MELVRHNNFMLAAAPTPVSKAVAKIVVAPYGDGLRAVGAHHHPPLSVPFGTSPFLVPLLARAKSGKIAVWLKVAPSRQHPIFSRRLRLESAFHPQTCPYRRHRRRTLQKKLPRNGMSCPGICPAR